MTRNSLSWARRSVILHSPWRELSTEMLLNRNDNGRAKLRAGSPVDHDGVPAGDGRISGGNDSVLAARYGTNSYDSQNAGSLSANQAAVVQLADERESKQAEPQIE